MTYAGPFASSMRIYKYNKDNQYEPGWKSPVGFISSSTGQLQRVRYFFRPFLDCDTSSHNRFIIKWFARYIACLWFAQEVMFTTLGWLQSSAFQCVMMWLWATGRVPYYTEFWKYPGWSIGWLAFVCNCHRLSCICIHTRPELMRCR